MIADVKQTRPGDLELAEFRGVGRQVIDAIAQYHEGLDRRPVLPRCTPAEVAALFAGDLDDDAEPAAKIVADWQQRVLPLLTAVTATGRRWRKSSIGSTNRSPTPSKPAVWRW
jgi:hypothetical protein